MFLIDNNNNVVIMTLLCVYYIYIYINALMRNDGWMDDSSCP